MRRGIFWLITIFIIVGISLVFAGCGPPQYIKDLREEYRSMPWKIDTISNMPKVNRFNVENNVNKSLLPYTRIFAHFENSNTAEDPSFNELISFIIEDDTDSHSYDSPNLALGYICGGFAEEVHNNAEQFGIRAAVTIVDFKYGTTKHVLNAFNTTDKGMVFIDCTGKRLDIFSHSPLPLLGETIYEIGDINSYDTIAYLQIGEPMGRINGGLSYGLDYFEYKRWVSDVKNIKKRFYEADTEVELNQIVNESNCNLGSFFEPFNEVKSIEIYW